MRLVSSTARGILVVDSQMCVQVESRNSWEVDPTVLLNSSSYKFIDCHPCQLSYPAQHLLSHIFRIDLRRANYTHLFAQNDC